MTARAPHPTGGPCARYQMSPGASFRQPEGAVQRRVSLPRPTAPLTGTDRPRFRFRAAFLAAFPLLAAFAMAPPAFADQASANSAAAFSDIRIGGDVSRFTLDNGLEVLVIEDHRAPVVTHMIWYKVGAADEQPGTSALPIFSST